jgi:hypothetical protein
MLIVDINKLWNTIEKHCKSINGTDFLLQRQDAKAPRKHDPADQRHVLFQLRLGVGLVQGSEHVLAYDKSGTQSVDIQGDGFMRPWWCK